MEKKLKITIEKLYQVFSIYPFNANAEACPCCISDLDKQTLFAKPLRKLEDENLSKYVFKAMSTWGEVDDFKHYLPRIFELLAITDGFILSTSTIFDKLDYGKSKSWNDNEQQAIKKFLLVWWKSYIKKASYFSKEIFIETYKFLEEIDALLNVWTLDFHDNSFKNYVDLVYNNYYNLLARKKHFKALKDEDRAKLIVWIQKNAELFEPAFFHFEQIDEEMADKISKTLYIYEHTD